jgi:hypothetical protein
LEQLAGGNLRINCGGSDYVSEGETTWGYDRFYRGGTVLPEAWDVEDMPCYLTSRVFSEGELNSGYHIPLPRGEYRIALHFTRGPSQAFWPRRFSVLLEAETAIENFEPRPGDARNADIHTRIETIEDGMLDIDFVAHVSNAEISAIEVVRVP